jgi:hypothetical protein
MRRAAPEMQGRCVQIPMRDSERYLVQAEVVMRLAARAETPAEKDVYLSIAEGWRRLAAEVLRNEVAPELRSFKPSE